MPICIYTIVHSEKLDDLHLKCKKDGKVKIEENRNWATAATLLQEAQLAEVTMMIVFAAAEYTRDLIYYGSLESIEINKKTLNKFATTFYVSDLTPFNSPYLLKTSLIVASSGKAIPDGYIRPYVICKTPKQLMTRRSTV